MFSGFVETGIVEQLSTGRTFGKKMNSDKTALRAIKIAATSRVHTTELDCHIDSMTTFCNAVLERLDIWSFRAWWSRGRDHINRFLGETALITGAGRGNGNTIV